MKTSLAKAIGISFGTTIGIGLTGSGCFNVFTAYKLYVIADGGLVISDEDTKKIICFLYNN